MAFLIYKLYEDHSCDYTIIPNVEYQQAQRERSKLSLTREEVMELVNIMNNLIPLTGAEKDDYDILIHYEFNKNSTTVKKIIKISEDDDEYFYVQCQVVLKKYNKVGDYFIKKQYTEYFKCDQLHGLKILLKEICGSIDPLDKGTIFHEMAV